MSDDTLILSGARIIDGTGAEPVRGRSVVVERGMITGVVDEARAPRGTGVDLAGHTLLPGLINCHVHLCFGAEADPVRPMREEPLALTAIKALMRAQQTAEAGVTTVRDLGGREYAEIAVRRAIQEGWVAGARIVAAGGPMCMTGGHGHFRPGGRRARRRPRRCAVGQRRARTSSRSSPPARSRPRAWSRVAQGSASRRCAAIEEARKAGRRTAAHAMAASGISDAIAAGITSIEHGIYLTDEIVAHMRRDGTFLVPTLNAPVAIAAGGLAAGIPEFMVRKSELVMSAHVASFQLAHKSGVRIAAGADSGTPLNFHGSLPELELMVKYGMTPLEAIRSATTVAADCLGLGAVTGRIAPGYAADLIAVAGDPAERLQALADLKLVLANGRTIRRDGDA
jgi:imidazolonepropionase-like amidohydrolase